MSEFTAPLSRFATHFIERWAFEPSASGTHVVRSFELHPRTWWGGLLLRLIAPLMRRAVDRHLADMDAAP